MNPILLYSASTIVAVRGAMRKEEDDSREP